MTSVNNDSATRETRKWMKRIKNCNNPIIPDKPLKLDIQIVGCEEDIAEIERRYDAGDPVARFLIDNSSIREKPDCRKCKWQQIADQEKKDHRMCDSYEVCMYERGSA